MPSSISNALRGYEIVDLSHTLDDKAPAAYRMYNRITWMSPTVRDRFNAAMLLIFEHAGTHVDAPNHLVSIGEPTIEETPLSQWMGDCCVISMKGIEQGGLVKASNIERWEQEHGVISKGEFVLFNFGWPNGWTAKPQGGSEYRLNPGLSEEAAKYLVSRGVGLVGLDVPSIDSYKDEGSPAHRIILEKKIALLETLINLEKLPPRGSYLIALPLKIKGGSGSPVRAVALVPNY
jgi:kynurenine formamidase